MTSVKEKKLLALLYLKSTSSKQREKILSSLNESDRKNLTSELQSVPIIPIDIIRGKGAELFKQLNICDVAEDVTLEAANNRPSLLEKFILDTTLFSIKNESSASVFLEQLTPTAVAVLERMSANEVVE
ncbi:hypothetical protein K6Y31_20295 [Motilimonas cestriensis]|uniref:Magnesium transporter MgtE intracellular domain-containing protein n=1 Tax=Motilimonas cestriensis TaxID=2742685 RepID=A0ABS8WEX6_9GAMM|nr:hypothetical protein [Motilimonas cestriensis]MCE2597118.1 hypothetical protein [Motilimonas cestriensis]